MPIYVRSESKVISVDSFNSDGPKFGSIDISGDETEGPKFGPLNF